MSENKKSPTSGKFEISDSKTGKILVSGISKQCEICSRDYLTWLLKGKAPKILQAAYDSAPAPKDAKILFSVKITALAPVDFAAATAPAPKNITPKYLKLLELLAAEVAAHPELAVIIRTSLKNMTAEK